MRDRLAAPLLALLMASGATSSAASDCALSSAPDITRTDQKASGNRVVESCGLLEGSVVDVHLGAEPTWVLPDPRHRGSSWLVLLADGRVKRIRVADGAGATVDPEPLASLLPGTPPIAMVDEAGELRIASALAAAGAFDDAIPGARVAEADAGSSAVLVGPSDRYPHGVLGDDVEASALRISTDDGSALRVVLEETEVIEGLSAIAAELGDDGPFGFLVTVSDADHGARLRAYGEDGHHIAESPPIGHGFRWLHQIGVGPTGPGGEIEVIAVRTPHIGGVVEAYRLEGDRFERVAALPGYSSHVLGSANLDMALLADTDADEQLEVVVPTGAMTELAVLERTMDGFTELARLPLDGRLASNVAAAVDRVGRLSLAAATDDGRLRVFR